MHNVNLKHNPHTHILLILIYCDVSSAHMMNFNVFQNIAGVFFKSMSNFIIGVFDCYMLNDGVFIKVIVCKTVFKLIVVCIKDLNFFIGQSSIKN